MKNNYHENLQEEESKYRMDEAGTLPLPKTHAAVMDSIGAYAMSLQGSLHISRSQPCQDYSDFRFLTDAGLLIGAISDGVGSCSLSHWGSYTVVVRTLDVLEEELKEKLSGKQFEKLEGRDIGDILRKAFSESKTAVEEIADQMQQPVLSFYSTLTAVIYNGSMLYYGHIGDDGIVAQFEDGTYELITTRHKGEEANSVNPLQAGSPDHLWQFGRASKPVVGFLMSTDGVLDSYVKKRNQNNRVYYPFLKNALYSMLNQREKEEAVQEAYGYMRKQLDHQDYRSVVTDDITILAAANLELLKTAAQPSFSEEEWNREEIEYSCRVQEMLYPKNRSQETRPGSRTVTDSTQKRREKSGGHRKAEKKQEKRAEKRADEDDQNEKKGIIASAIDIACSWREVLVAPFSSYEKWYWYCPKCRKIYESTQGASYRYCPECGIKMKHLDPNQKW